LIGIERPEIIYFFSKNPNQREMDLTVVVNLLNLQVGLELALKTDCNIEL